MDNTIYLPSSRPDDTKGYHIPANDGIPYLSNFAKLRRSGVKICKHCLNFSNAVEAGDVAIAPAVSVTLYCGVVVESLVGFLPSQQSKASETLKNTRKEIAKVNEQIRVGNNEVRRIRALTAIENGKLQDAQAENSRLTQKPYKYLSGVLGATTIFLLITIIGLAVGEG